jgi:hypothetical protein
MIDLYSWPVGQEVVNVSVERTRLRKESCLWSPSSSPPRLHPGITQEVAPNESQRDPKPLTQ